MTVTAVHLTKRGNVSVDIDGEYALTVQRAAWEDSGLSTDDEITEEQLEELKSASDYTAAKKKALDMLSARSYTRHVLVERVSAKFGHEAADKAADRMEELGLIDDSDYASRYAQELSEERGYAPKRIRWELRKKGLSHDDIDAALETVADRDETARAIEILEKKYGFLSNESDIRRAAALLERYGYGTDAVRTAIHAVRRFGNEEFE